MKLLYWLLTLTVGLNIKFLYLQVRERALKSMVDGNILEIFFLRK